ncbi:hypothetical protein ABXS75_10915 [Roseburia hominis]
MDLKYKKIQKSFRLSEDLVQYLEDTYDGKNLTEKLEAMIQHCILEKPRLDKEIAFRKKELARLKKEASRIEALNSKIQSIQYHLDAACDLLK